MHEPQRDRSGGSALAEGRGTRGRVRRSGWPGRGATGWQKGLFMLLKSGSSPLQDPQGCVGVRHKAAFRPWP